MSQEEHKKKEGLKLAQLASYDDKITDALVDRVYFWTIIRKNRSRYSASRRIKDEQIANIIRQAVIVEKDPAKACTELLELPGLKEYNDGLPSKDEKEHFQRHLRKYVNMYSTDCPFEVSTTNRYTINTQEAAAVARKFIKKGDVVKYLSGIQVAITREEETDLDLTRRDFSIVVSSRKRTPSLFLGPARFANHDCDANARLTTTGSNGMAVTAVRDVEVDDEITVSYGEDYFGIDNCECLCATCERLERNGWAPTLPKDPDEDDENEKEDSYSLRTPRKRTSGGSSGSQTPTNSPSKPSASKPSQYRAPPTVDERPRTPDNTLTSARKRKSPWPNEQPAKKQASTWLETVRIATPERPSPLSQEIRPDNVSTGSSPPLSNMDGSQVSHGSTAATSVSTGLHVTKKATESEQTPVQIIVRHAAVSAAVLLAERTFSFCEGDGVSVIVDLQEQQEQEAREEESAIASEVPINVDDTQLAPTIEITSAAEADSANVNHRKPGDYTLTTTLLVTQDSRWVECHNCEHAFVVAEKQTRAFCPRCERHSKLYGYRWPKTDKIGKNDTEERITDHRTVHQFVAPEEEREIRKGKKASLNALLAERLQAQRNTDSEPQSSEPDDRRARLRATGRRKRGYEDHISESEDEAQKGPRKKARVEETTPKKKDRVEKLTPKSKSKAKKSESTSPSKSTAKGSKATKKVQSKKKTGSSRIEQKDSPKRRYQWSGKYVGVHQRRIEKRSGKIVSRKPTASKQKAPTPTQKTDRKQSAKKPKKNIRPASPSPPPRIEKEPPKSKKKPPPIKTTPKVKHSWHYEVALPSPEDPPILEGPRRRNAPPPPYALPSAAEKARTSKDTAPAQAATGTKRPNPEEEDDSSLADEDDSSSEVWDQWNNKPIKFDTEPFTMEELLGGYRPRTHPSWRIPDSDSPPSPASPATYESSSPSPEPATRPANKKKPTKSKARSKTAVRSGGSAMANIAKNARKRRQTQAKRKYVWSGKYARHRTDPSGGRVDEQGQPLTYYRGRPPKDSQRDAGSAVSESTTSRRESLQDPSRPKAYRTARRKTTGLVEDDGASEELSATKRGRLTKPTKRWSGVSGEDDVYVRDKTSSGRERWKRLSA